MPYVEPDTESLLEELQEILESNGNIPVLQRQKLQLKMLGAIYNMVKPLPERVASLERKNLLMLMEKHPKATAAFAAGFFLMLELWHSSAWRPWLGKVLGIPIP